MMRRSIALQLALWLSIGMLVFWLGGAAISTVVLRSELDKAFDETLRQSAFRLLPLANRSVGDEPGRAPVPRLDNRGPGRRDGMPGQPPIDAESFTYLVFDEAGNVRLRAEDAPTTLPALPARDGFVSVDGHRGFVSTDRRNGMGILVLETTTARSDALWGAVSGLLWPLAALLPLSALGIWQAVRLALRPVKRLSRDIALRNSTNLTPLNAGDQPVELAPIADEVEGLLDRLRAAMEAERTFAASSAHELRTPIAGALAQTQLLSRELGEHASASRLKDIEASLRGLADLSEKLLQLSRLEAGFARSNEVTELGPVLDLVVRDFQAQASSGSRVRYQKHADARMSCAINPDAFAVAVRNLIHNALIHGKADGTVFVEAGPGGMVRVRNHGPVVVPETMARLTERFARGTTKASGTGLGLAVVATIMDQTGGTLTLTSPPEGWSDGFEAALRLGDHTGSI
jgi:two-component system, OmpR family, sensor kinase